MKVPKAFVGAWRIVETALWDSDVLDELVPAHMTFDSSGGGVFAMICVRGEMDCRYSERNDEMDEASGRGWAERKKNGTLRGRIYFHRGDDSSFVARGA